jgi:hypothetical protein
MITFALDISAQKRAEEAALAAVRAKSFFIANISHGKIRQRWRYIDLRNQNSSKWHHWNVAIFG